MIQPTREVVSGVVEGLRQQPALLAIVVLNVIAIGAGLWFMNKIVQISQSNMQLILESCFNGGK